MLVAASRQWTEMQLAHEQQSNPDPSHDYFSVNRLQALPLALAFILALPTLPLRAQDDPAGKAALTSPEAFPAAYKDDEILADSVSPDGKYGLIFPKRDLVPDMQDPKLFLVALKPFRVLTEVPRHNSYLYGGHNSYTVAWSKDSSVVLMIENIKWGPDKAFLVPIHDGKPGKITDLTDEVKNLVRPSYKKSRAEPFNESIDFIFEGDDHWEFNPTGEITVDCTCTTDPKRLDGHSWTMRFQGRWDPAKARFVEKKLTHIPPPSAKERAGG